MVLSNNSVIYKAAIVRKVINYTDPIIDVPTYFCWK
jgi:hypothetical protein